VDEIVETLKEEREDNEKQMKRLNASIIHSERMDDHHTLFLDKL